MSSWKIFVFLLAILLSIIYMVFVTIGLYEANLFNNIAVIGTLVALLCLIFAPSYDDTVEL